MVNVKFDIAMYNFNIKCIVVICQCRVCTSKCIDCAWQCMVWSNKCIAVTCECKAFGLSI